MRKYKYPEQKMIYIYKYEHKYEMIIEYITGTIKKRKKEKKYKMQKKIMT